MAERPLIFSAPMIRALLDGRKTQTRRVLGTRKLTLECDIFDGTWTDSYVLDPGNAEWRARFTPYAPGDRLWVREAFCPRFGYPAPVATPHYRADDDRPEWRRLWKPSIHMPRWASRLTLIVTDVRVQRLQDISTDDVIAEGVSLPWVQGGTLAMMAQGIAKDGYRTLWNSLHGPDAWDANPWVCALTFTVHRCNIDQMEGAQA